LIGRKAWFGPRRFGWGLGPVSAEGWAVVAVGIAAIIVVAVLARHAPWADIPVVAALLIIVFAKGTSPGGSREWEEFQASKNGGGV
jgi:hypothetical protein